MSIPVSIVVEQAVALAPICEVDVFVFSVDYVIKRKSALYKVADRVKLIDGSHDFHPDKLELTDITQFDFLDCSCIYFEAN